LIEEKLTKKLRDSIILFSAISIFIVGLIISVITIYPLYKHMKKNAYQDLSTALQFRKMAILEAHDNYKESARLITSRTRMREMLELYNRGEIDLKTLVDDSRPRMLDAMNITKAVAGVTRYDIRNKMIFHVGQTIPQEFNISPDSTTNTIKIHGPITIDNSIYLVVAAPILDREAKRVGSDIVLFNVERLSKIVHAPIGLGESGEVILGEKESEHDSLIIFHLIHADRSIAEIEQEETFLKKIITKEISLPSNETKIVERTINQEGLIIAYDSIPDVPWVLILKIDKDEIYSPIHTEVLLLSVLIVLFIALGIAITIMLLRPLAGKIIVHAFKLEEIGKRKEAEVESTKHLSFLENVRKISMLAQQSTNLDEMMSKTLDLVLSIFNCDRAFLLYPCDPDTDLWSIPMARNKPEWSGLMPTDNIPVTPEAAAVFKAALETKEPVVFDPTNERFIPLGKEFSIQSQIIMCIYPRIGKPWLFGVHQCSDPRIWAGDDVKTFKEIGSRITDALSNLLLFKDLKESKYRLARAEEIGRLGNWEWDIVTQELLWSDEVFRMFGLVPGETVTSFKLFEKMVHPDDLDSVNESINAALNNIKPYDIFFRIISKDGHEKTIHCLGEVMYSNEKPVKMFGIQQDVTQRIKAEKEAKKNYLNQTAINALLEISLEGVSLAELFKRYFDVIYSLPWLNISKKGAIFLIEDEPDVLVMKESRGLDPSTIKGCKRVSFGKCLCGQAALSGKFIFSDHMNKIHTMCYEGVSEHGHYIIPIISPNISKTKVMGIINLYLEEGHTYDEQEVKFLETAANTLAELIQRKQAEEALQKSETNLLEAQHIARLGRWELDLTTQSLEWSDSIFDMFELNPDLFGASYEAFLAAIHPDDREKVNQAYAQSLEDRQPYNIEHRLLMKDGRVKWVYEKCRTDYDEQGQPIRSVGIVQDITERKKAEEDIKLHEERLESMLKLNKMIDASEKEIMDFVNNELIAISQSKFSFIGLMNEDESIFILHAYSKSAMDECLIIDKPVEFSVETAGVWAEAIRQRRPIVINDYNDTDLPKKSYPAGHVELTRLVSVPIFEAEGIVALACVANKNKDYEDSDVQALTSMLNDMWRLIQRKRAEEEKKNLWDQLLQAQKLESVGRLTGGIAHDFNNMLAAILGYSELSLMKIGGNHPLAEKFHTIIFAAEKASNLVKQLLAFSRKQVLEIRLNNLNIIIENMGNMLARVIGEDIKLNLSLNEDVSNVRVDQTQMEQILLNLAVNARDAMPDGGSLTIQTQDVFLDEAYTKIHKDVKPGQYVMLSVEDTGSGIKKEVQDKIFEPFFTTKEKGKGTGLGLSTVFGIVKQHNGSIWLYSEPDKGTTFKIYLPFAPGDAEKTKVEYPSEILGGHETILIVDDDDLVLGMTKELLDSIGYATLSARSGEEALRISDEREETIDLILTDVVMTGISGWDTAEEIIKKRPEMKVIFTSGYMDNPIVLQNIIENKMPFINKPCKPLTMANTVREVLDSNKNKEES